jgi:thiamine transporter
VVGLLAGTLRNASSKPGIAIVAGSLVGIAGRFVCSFLSGVIIWGVYAEGQNVIIYSLSVNASVMIPEIIVTAVAGFSLFSIPVLKKQLHPA